MAEVKILVPGYTTADTAAASEEKTCPTITLVRDKDIVMVCDPGVLDSQQILVDALKREGLAVNDVNYVFITHSHIDHYRNVGMFPGAKTLEYFGIWDGGGVKDWEEHFTDDITIIKTPGHNYDGLTLLIKTEKGVVAICGDVFWKENYPEKDIYASDLAKLQESRKKVLQLANFVIPGHAGMYPVRKP
ncbi:MAG TPA: MBL fold metallo-hydrolase [Candidatus Paceibacterota bacterium]|nr:MBL fold metallo-hydrolase [Candidatus Paceibacterota bacterium]